MRCFGIHIRSWYPGSCFWFNSIVAHTSMSLHYWKTIQHRCGHRIWFCLDNFKTPIPWKVFFTYYFFFITMVVISFDEFYLRLFTNPVFLIVIGLFTGLMGLYFFDLIFGVWVSTIRPNWLWWLFHCFFVAQPHPGSLTPSERRFERSMTTGMRTLISNEVKMNTYFFVT